MRRQCEPNGFRCQRPREAEVGLEDSERRHIESLPKRKPTMFSITAKEPTREAL